MIDRRPVSHSAPIKSISLIWFLCITILHLDQQIRHKTRIFTRNRPTIRKLQVRKSQFANGLPPAFGRAHLIHRNIYFICLCAIYCINICLGGHQGAKSACAFLHLSKTISAVIAVNPMSISIAHTFPLTPRRCDHVMASSLFSIRLSARWHFNGALKIAAFRMNDTYQCPASAAYVHVRAYPADNTIQRNKQAHHNPAQFPSGSSPEGFLCQTLNMKETSSLIIGARIPHRTGIYPVIHVERSQYRTSRQAGDEWENEKPGNPAERPVAPTVIH